MSNAQSLTGIAAASNEIKILETKGGNPPSSWVVVDPDFRKTNLKRGFGRTQILSLARFLRQQLGAKNYDALWHLDGRRKTCAKKK